MDGDHIVRDMRNIKMALSLKRLLPLELAP